MAFADQLILGNIFNFDVDRCFNEAMVVKDGRVVYVGSKSVAEKFCDENTKVLDYGENTVYPGFIEAHCHGVMAGQRLAFDINIAEGKSMQEYLDMTAKFIEENPGRDFYKGSGWAKYSEPTAEMLDKVCSEVPVVLTSVDGHSMWLNSKALQEAGINAEVAKQYGYDMIHVDENGNPSGVLCERATTLGNAITYPTKEMIKEGLLAWQDFAFANGITAAAEAMSDYFPGGEDAYLELVQEGKWKLRTYAYPTLVKSAPDKIVDTLKDFAKKYDTEYFKVVGLKCFIDGVVEAHTASLIEGYADQPEYYGVNYFTGKQDLLNERVAAVNAAGFPVHFHTIGDMAVKTAMDAVEYSVMKNCDIRQRNCLAHLQVVSKEDIKRIADYNCTAIVAPLWVPITEPYFEEEIKNLGEERAWNEYPIKSFEDAGATICFHTDFPVSSEMNPSKQLFSAVKRMSPDLGVKSVKNPDEGISFLRALMASSINVAYMLNADDKIGDFGIGKYANCTVYDTNFLTCSAEDASKAKLVATVIDGEEVFRG